MYCDCRSLAATSSERRSCMQFIILQHVASCLLTSITCVAGHVASRTSDLQDDLSCIASTASLISLVTWSVQRTGGRPLGRRHDGGRVETKMLIA